MGENATQPRFENIISKQVSTWPLTFLFKPSNICPMQHFFWEYNVFSIKPNLSMKWHHFVQSPYIREYSIYLTWMQNHFQRYSCAKFLYRSSERRTTICQNGILWVPILNENGFPKQMCWCLYVQSFLCTLTRLWINWLKHSAMIQKDMKKTYTFFGKRYGCMSAVYLTYNWNKRTK